MSNKINVLQILPYFPPHKGGLETVAEEYSKYYVKNGYGNVLNLTFGVGQEEGVFEYSKDGYKVIVLPAFDLISNFPFPKFWQKSFWKAIKIAKTYKPDIIQTHTRFFLSSFLGGILSKSWRVKWVHIEHGSSYIKLDSNIKNKISYIYDNTLGRWVFKRSNFIVSISDACKKFINRFGRRKDLKTLYRGIDIIGSDIKGNSLRTKFKDKIIVGFVGRLYKWKNVESLVKAYYDLDKKIKDKLQLVIVGNGEDYDRLVKLDNLGEAYFTGGVDFQQALELQSQFDIHIHPSNPGGGLATTLIQAMYLGLTIVATPYEGANEVIKNGYNGILLDDDSIIQLSKGITEAVKNVNNIEWKKNNEEIIKTQFDWNNNIKDYYLLYKRLLNE